VDCKQKIRGKVRRGRCNICYRAHLRQLKQAGTFESLAGPADEITPASAGPKILDHIEIAATGCWLYKGFINAKGYGLVDVSRRAPQVRAHRAVWEYVVGPIPDGLELDHLCHGRDEDCPGGVQCMHRRCVNPAHLEPVPGAINNARSNSPTSVNARKTRCIRGHEFTPENTYWRLIRNGKPQPSRQCRECRRLWRKRYRASS
jgi:hypothetical protein